MERSAASNPSGGVEPEVARVYAAAKQSICENGPESLLRLASSMYVSVSNVAARLKSPPMIRHSQLNDIDAVASKNIVRSLLSSIATYSFTPAPRSSQAHAAVHFSRWRQPVRASNSAD